MVAVPAHAGTVHIGFMRSLIADTLRLAQRGDVVSINDQVYDAEIDTARARIVSDFMASKCTHLMMIDSDLCWEAGGITRLVDHTSDEVQFVAGAYPYRRDPISFPLHLLETRTLVDGLLEVKAVPGGFVCVTRAAIEAMIAKYEHLQFYTDKTANPIWALFDHVWEGKRRLSEDLSFCARWRELGGRIWLDPGLVVGHVGNKLFVGKLGDVQA